MGYKTRFDIFKLKGKPGRIRDWMRSHRIPAGMLFIIMGIILSPPSIDYHYMLMLIPILILLNWLLKNPSKVLWIFFGISYLLIASSLPYISPKITGGLWAVLAYPKLYGALGLWVLSLRASYSSRSFENRLASY